jgi:hypothetical protein
MRKGAVPGVPTIRPREVMFSRIVVAVQAPEQVALVQVQRLAAVGVARVARLRSGVPVDLTPGSPARNRAAVFGCAW